MTTRSALRLVVYRLLQQHFMNLFSAMIAHKVNVSHTFVLPLARLRQQ